MDTVLGFFVGAGAWPFTAAAAVLLGLALVELLGLLVAGSGLSHLADSLLPAHDGDAGSGGEGLAGQLLGWLHWGKVPALAILAMFLAGFAVTGWSLQWVLIAVAGAPLPAPLASLAAIPGALLCVRRLALPLARLLPGDHSTAVYVENLAGLVGIVTLGASAQSPGQARVKDRHGQVHYLRIVPAEGIAELTQGQRVLVLERREELFVVAEPDSYTDALSNEILALLTEVSERPAGAVPQAETTEAVPASREKR